MVNEKTFYDDAFGSNDSEDDFEKDLVFVIMAFRDDMNETFVTIEDECKKIGLSAVRADDNASIGSNFIIREITDLIERAEFIICDLTYERPNCYYELGYAHGVGNSANDVLIIATEGTSLHFDIAPLRVRYYSSETDLRSIINSNLKKMIATTR